MPDIQSITTYRLSPETGDEPMILSYERYTAEGLLLMEVQYELGEPVTETGYHYENGLLMHKRERDIPTESIDLTRYMYQQNRVIREDYFFDDELYQQVHLTYDEKGRECSRRVTDEEGHQSERTETRYDDSLQQSISEHYNASDERWQVVTSSIDAQGNETAILICEYLKDRLIREDRMEFIYDHRGDQVAWKQWINDNLVESYEQRWLKEGRLLQRETCDHVNRKKETQVLQLNAREEPETIDTFENDRHIRHTIYLYNTEGHLSEILEDHIIDAEHTVRHTTRYSYTYRQKEE